MLDEYVQEKVNGPGLALLVLGVLSILANIGITALRGISTVSQAMLIMDYAEAADWIALATSSGWQVVMGLVGIFVGAFIAYAGTRLRSGQSASIVYAGAVMAMLPCCLGLPCCCLGLPIGIWVIVTMQDDQVKAAFA